MWCHDIMSPSNEPASDVNIKPSFFFIKYTKEDSAGKINNLTVERARGRDELTGQFLTPREVNSQL